MMLNLLMAIAALVAPVHAMEPGTRSASELAAEACGVIMKRWVAQRTTALRGLRACNLPLFNEECQKLREVAKEGLRPDSPCKLSSAGRNIKFETLNCEIVKIPPHCGE